MSVLKCKEICKDIKTGLLVFFLQTNPLAMKKKLKNRLSMHGCKLY